MGYESKVIIVERNEFTKNFRGEPLDKPIVNAITVAEYDLCKMGYDNQTFFNAFKREIDYDIFLPGVDETGDECMMMMHEDCYGEHMKSADIGELVKALRACEAREHYRRIPPLIAMLESFNLDEWNTEHCRLEAVHYGY